MQCYTSDLIPLDKAITRMLSTIKPTEKHEIITLDHAVGRILAEDVLSPIDVPGFDNSAMDGYAFKHPQTNIGKQNTFEVIGESFAGNAFIGEVKSHQCVRIMTGAVLPQGCDTVVMQENTSQHNTIQQKNEIIISKLPTPQANARKKGSDIVKTSSVLTKGKRIAPVDIGLLASVGLTQVKVYKKLTIAIFSTGDELIQPGNTIRDGHIFDSNRPMLKAMLRALHFDVLDLGPIKDDKSAITDAFNKAASKADCIITSGGVSVGNADYTREVLEELGDIHFWKIAIKPGKPLAFGKIKQCLFWGLPGNSVSCAVTFDVIAQKGLEKHAGLKAQNTIKIKAKAIAPFRKKPGRTDYQRALCQLNENGELTVAPCKTQSSAVLSGFTSSHCYAVLKQEQSNIEIGEWVTIMFYSALLK